MTRIWQKTKQNSMKIQDIVKNTIKLLINTLIEWEQHKKHTIYKTTKSDAWQWWWWRWEVLPTLWNLMGRALQKQRGNYILKVFYSFTLFFFLSMCNIYIFFFIVRLFCVVVVVVVCWVELGTGAGTRTVLLVLVLAKIHWARNIKKTEGRTRTVSVRRMWAK